jgi:DNA-binding transcriptional regulator LsrR (DeoR family)
MGRIKYQEAIGLEVKRGRPRRMVEEKEKEKLTRLYVVQELSTREVAKAMQISEASVRRRLKAAGIPARSNAPRSRLRLFDQARLFGYIGAVGINKTAKRWRISRRTLQRYLAKLRTQGKRE